MTWTYSGDPAATDRDAVRFMIGDTDSTDEQLSDEEVAYAIAQEATLTHAAIYLARGLATKFARLVDMAIGDLKYSYSQRQGNYESLVERLETIRDESAASPYAGGISVSDKDTREEDSDRVDPIFKKGMFDRDATQLSDEKDLWNT